MPGPTSPNTDRPNRSGPELGGREVKLVLERTGSEFNLDRSRLQRSVSVALS